MKKTTLVLILLSLAAKIIVYIHDVILAFYFGASDITDAYIISTTLPMLLFGFFAMSVSTTLIPKYHEITKLSSENDAKKFTSNVLNVHILVLIFIIFLVNLFAKQVVYILGSGFNQETIILATKFTKITSLSIIFYGISSVFKSFLHIKNKFWITTLINIPKYLIIIGFIVLSYYFDILFLAYGFLLSSIMQIFIYLPFIIRAKFKYFFNVNIKDKHLKEYLLLIIPIFMTVAINDLNNIINKTLASNIDVGAISSLNYAIKVVSLFHVLIVTSISTVAYPLFSKYHSANDKTSFIAEITSSIRVCLFFLIPIFFGLICYNQEVISILYGRGEFDYEAIKNTSQALFFYSFGLIGMGIQQILNRVLYSMKLFKLTFMVSLFTVIINIALNLAFFFLSSMGINGLALATSISMSISAIALFIILLIKLKIDILTKLISPFIKIFVSSFSIIAVYIFFYPYIRNHMSPILGFIISVLISLFIFLISLMILKFEEVFLMMKKLKHYYIKIRS